MLLPGWPTICHHCSTIEREKTEKNSEKANFVSVILQCHVNFFKCSKIGSWKNKYLQYHCDKLLQCTKYFLIQTEI